MKYKVILCYSNGDREEDDAIFETESEAEEHGLYLRSCYHEGAEILNLSNPGDYPLDSGEDVDFEIMEIRD